ncbi:RNA polymerase sigma factor [Desulfobacula phenolica]|uniref:RNA polymerase sigma factor, sigma-70 family n=1 Tax=Desulfobacula phenolica TaxID=90732 RepID=A0A1H2J2X1_9BACT|nr:RNA polymerase sigma factor [Desulfobacula phenolica]SDU50408.1 RNA polymerase sigma factor, sigma-70 family [Desulfobacula phenolica]
MKNHKKIEQLVSEAVRGSKNALEEIIRRIQKPVYSLSLRMLFNPEDAEDTAQEILITIITNLHGYRHKGPFRAWAMRIAVNKLKNVRKSYAEKKMSNIDNLEGILDRYEAKGWFSKPREIPEPYLEAETRSVCTHALLLCLDRSHRLAFILGVVMEVSSQEGAQILDITPAAYRKRLSRARSRIKDFLVNNCALFNSSNRCRCKHILPAYLEKGWIDPEKPIFVRKKDDGEIPTKLGSYLKEMDELKKLSAVYKSISPSNFDFVDVVKINFQNNLYRIISDPKLS